jgi:hypothetical protein
MDCKDFFKNWCSDSFHFGKFNRWYSDYFVTVYQTGLTLSTPMVQSALMLEANWSYADWLLATADYFRFKNLVWSGLPPAPHWLPAAQGDFTFGKTASNSEDSDEVVTTRKKTSTSRATSSTDDANTVQLALATALLVLTTKK